MVAIVCGVAAAVMFEIDARGADTPKPDPPPATFLIAASSTHTQECPAYTKAITFYRHKYRGWRDRQGLPGPVPRVWYRNCRVLQRRAVEWRDRAADSRRAYVRWVNDQWNWRAWMPRGWVGIARCESGHYPPNWQHNSGTYQGAFGFAVTSWDRYVGEADPRYGPYPSEAYLASPRQQLEVALAIYRHFGLSGWGCRGAFYG